MKKLLLLLLVFSVFASYAQVPSYVPTNGLVAYYPFNGNANDASGNGNNGTVNGATLTTDRSGSANNAYSFACNSIHANINTTSITNQMTLSFWYFRNSQGCIGPRVMEFSQGSNLPGDLIIEENYPTGLRIGHVTSTGLANTLGWMQFNTLVNQTWSNYVYTNDGNVAKIYQNGTLINQYNSPGLPVLNGDVAFGWMNHPANDGVNGKLDDIAIYNRALSQSEITGLYNAGTNTCLPSYLPTTGLVGYWPFCGNANDESGNGNNGTVNGATLTTDRFGNVGKAYSFDGNDWISVPNNSTINFQNSFSVCVWVKTNQSNINAGIIGKWNDFNGAVLGGQEQFALIASDELNNTVRGVLRTNLNPNSNFEIQYNNSGYSNNEWNLFTYTWTNNRINLYKNGSFIGSTNTIGDMVNYNQNLEFGRYAGGQATFGGGNVHFKGTLDDIAIYNRALTATEVQNLYNASAPTTCTANIINNDTTICKGQSVTLNADAVASGSVTDINGNVYPTVNIGSQTWMQKNLNVSKYKNGDIIPQVTNATQWAALTTGAWCWYNNDSATYAATYGKLYNWYAVNDTRGLAPDGWHVPSMHDYGILMKYLDPISDTSACLTCTPSNTAGGKIKEAGTINWLTPNTGANNSSGFTARAAGSRIQTGQFFYNGMYASFWTSSIQDVDKARDIQLYYLYESSIYDNHIKKNGQSVRLVSDYNFTYLWSTGATTPSITVSPTVTTTYYLTVTDANGNTCRDSVKVFVNTAIPSAPATLTGATDVCPNFSSPTSATSNVVTYTAATVSTASSYTWTVPAGVTIVSGQGTNSITVTFASTFVSGAITVKSVNACGSSTSAKSLTVYKRVAATPGTIQKEFTPTSIVAVTNVTGLVSETYRIKKVTYATSYNWSMNQGTSATITHLNPLGANDTAVIVTFANCFLRDTLSVKSVTPCSVSAARTAILVGYTTPAAVAGITTVGGNFATCIGVNKTFTAIRGTPTTTQAPIASFRWTRPANTSIVSATSDSASITVSFNTGYTGGSISAKGVSQCSVIGTTASTAILQFLPPSVLSIASSTGSYNACIGNSITYSALVGAPTTSQVAASVFRWTKPNNTSITSASADSSTITLQFNTGYIGGTLSVKGQTSCGTHGTAKTQSLTHAGCAAGTKMSVPVTTTDAGSFELSLYPNPSAGEFKLLINAPLNKSKAVVKVIDIQGRLMKSFECNANQVIALGNELKPGVYMVEVRMGNEVKTVRAVRF